MYNYQEVLDLDIVFAINAVLGDAQIDSVSPMAGGRSGALLSVVSVNGVGYVVKKVDASRSMHQERAEQEFACMTIASELGVAPKLHYSNVERGVSIAEQILGAPLVRSEAHLERVARALRCLHQGPEFPDGICPVALAHMVDRDLREQNGCGLPEWIMHAIDEADRIMSPFVRPTPCHNDLNPTNIIETDEKVYFVDWEWAGMSNPFVDLAQLGVFGFPRAEQREELLGAYLERVPSDQERALMAMARVMALAVYAGGFYQTSQLSGDDKLPAALSIPDLLTYLRAQRERASASVVAASLLEETRREIDSDAYGDAKKLLQSKIGA
jgi:hypothetical protein